MICMKHICYAAAAIGETQSFGNFSLFPCIRRTMKENVGDTEQKIRMAIGSAAAAAAIFAPLKYKWKGLLSALAVGGLLTGVTKVSPFKRILGI